MKIKKKTKAATHAKTKSSASMSSRLPVGMQKTAVRVQRKEDFPKDSNTFSPLETGEPDTDQIPDIENPMGVQGGRGSTNQEGEGDRQNDQLDELKQIEPDLDLDK